MDDTLAMFLTIISGMSLVAWVITSWIRQRGVSHAQAANSLSGQREIELLSSENSGLKGQVSRLEERIAVLERIATDPAMRTANEIDQLR
jgi:hypothetical protein